MWRDHGGTPGRIVTMPNSPRWSRWRGSCASGPTGMSSTAPTSAAISVLKTYRPDLTDLRGRTVTGIQRHGKFLDLVAGAAPDGNGGQPGDGPLHLVVHLARAGWLRWRESLPVAPPKPSVKNPVAVRVHLDDGSGFDLTEAGTRKKLAVYLVRAVDDVPGVAAWAPTRSPRASTRRPWTRSWPRMRAAS